MTQQRIWKQKTTLQVYGLSGMKVYPYSTNITAQSFHSVSYILSLNISSHNTGQKYHIWGQGEFCGLLHRITSPALQYWTFQLGYISKCPRCHTMAWIFSYWPLTTHTQAQPQTTTHVICGWKSGNGTDFSLCTDVPLLKIIWLTNFPMQRDLSTWLYISSTSVQ